MILPRRRSMRLSMYAGSVAALGMAVFIPAAVASSRAAPPPLRNATTIVIRGQHVPGGCRFAGTNVVQPGQMAVEQDEISEDPSSCTMTMLQGTPVSISGAPPQGSSTLAQTATATASPPQGVTAAATVHSAGYSHTYTEDPARIDVTSVRNDIDWYWDGTALVGTETCNATYNWFTASGWGLHENNLQCNFDTSTYPQHSIDSTSYVHFQNGVFCAGTDTDVYYNRNHAIGYYNGALVGRWNVTLTGACQGLLSVKNTTARTMN